MAQRSPPQDKDAGLEEGQKESLLGDRGRSSSLGEAGRGALVTHDADVSLKKPTRKEIVIVTTAMFSGYRCAYMRLGSS